MRGFTDNGKILSTLAWRPKLDDLTTIVAHALAWENKLAERKAPRRTVLGNGELASEHDVTVIPGLDPGSMKPGVRKPDTSAFLILR